MRGQDTMVLAQHRHHGTELTASQPNPALCSTHGQRVTCPPPVTSPRTSSTTRAPSLASMIGMGDFARIGGVRRQGEGSTLYLLAVCDTMYSVTNRHAHD
eukprot:COSAG01_NODE_6084_length_3862_cov_2.626893_6_plen_100_part_00